MNIYRVSCYSQCGTYFASYLQFVIVIAMTEGEAIQHVKNWLAVTHNSFIREDEKSWSVALETEGISEGVISYHEDSDY